MNPCFAIIESNTLCSMSLQNILRDIYDQVEIHSYNNIDAFIRDSNRHIVHFFVSSDILFEQAEEFEMLKPQTTVLCQGRNEAVTKAGYMTLDCTMTEQEIVSDLLHLHHDLKKGLKENVSGGITDQLSPREKDVLVLIVKGFINKEIAEQLNISTPTAIFHRNNICEKLKTRSIGKLTVYAVLSGLVDINEI